MPLTIAVDETGNFRGPKLAGEKSKSGVAIVGTNQSSEQIDASIKSIAQRYGVSYPAGVHASLTSSVSIQDLVTIIEKDEKHSDWIFKFKSKYGLK